MENFPPHLPKKACNVKTHNWLKSVWWILFVVFISSLSSLALTLSTLVWFAPSFIPDQLVTNTQKIFKDQKEDLDVAVLNKTKQRLWYIYDKREKIGGRFYPDSAEKMQAVLFSSDGWAIVYAPNYKAGLEKNWEAFDYQGVSYKIEKVFVDSLSKLAYVKFAGNGFSFISFANWNDVSAGQSVWEISADAREKYVLGKQVDFSTEKSYSIWEPQFFYQLPELSEPGSLVVNSSGEMVGILDSNRSMIYGWMVDSQFAPILEKGMTDYMAVLWKGRMAHGFIKENDFIKRVAGFYVESSPTRITDETVGAGDLIVRIQNRPVEAADLSRQILSAPEKFSVTILRDGREFNVEVTKTKISK